MLSILCPVGACVGAGRDTVIVVVVKLVVVPFTFVVFAIVCAVVIVVDLSRTRSYARRASRGNTGSLEVRFKILVGEKLKISCPMFDVFNFAY